MTDDEQIDLVFTTIGNAAQMLRAIQPGACADSLQRQIDRSFYLDPTLAQRVLIAKDDVDRKMRLLRAAQAFVDVVEAVGNEVIAAMIKENELETKQ